MAKQVIREVAVDPPVPPEYVVYRRADIERFVAAARHTVARLEAELAAGPEFPVIDLVDPMPAEPEITSGKVINLPPWVDSADRDLDGASFFESFREPGEPLIAGAEQAYKLA